MHCSRAAPSQSKKTGAVEHLEVFNHAGLLFNGPPGMRPECPSFSLPTSN